MHAAIKTGSKKSDSSPVQFGPDLAGFNRETKVPRFSV